MNIELKPEERLAYLIIMVGGGNGLIQKIYENSDETARAMIMKLLGEYNQQIEPVMDAYGLGKDPEGVARAMMLTEDLIGCEPKGELLSVTPDEAVRKVTSCPWASSFSIETCRLLMAAMEEGVGKKYGLEIFCEQSMAGGAGHCIWKVRRKK
ncbi:MAG: hypothetical protein EPN93_17665 [Spirochaetes bacterium]|nr:MAG: hypothetical protein EPN93_17665 [Spirochaetota bacterium]